LFASQPATQVVLRGLKAAGAPLLMQLLVLAIIVAVIVAASFAGGR
jgi:hypothetical protein